MKRTLPFFVAAITGFLLIATQFSPRTKSWGEEVMRWFDIVAAFAFVLGGANLLKMNLQKISGRRAGWGYSFLTLIAFVGTLIVGLGKFGVRPADDYPNYGWSGNYLQEGGGFWWIFQYIFFPLAATMFAMLAFYIASAAFRAFRAKNTEATILLVTAFLILFGQTDYGTSLTSYLPDSLSAFRAENLKVTIMSVFNLAGTRAITIGIALGIVATSLKVLLGVDRSYLGQE